MTLPQARRIDNQLRGRAGRQGASFVNALQQTNMKPKSLSFFDGSSFAFGFPGSHGYLVCQWVRSKFANENGCLQVLVNL